MSSETGDLGAPATLTLADARSQRLYRQLALRAVYRPSAAIKLFCLECVGYYYADAKACTTVHCPLWAVSSRIFRRGLPPRPDSRRVRTEGGE